MSRTHSSLGASSATRWMACPGSFRVSQAVTTPAVSSRWAAEGSLAHAIAEELLRNGGPIDQSLGQNLRYDGHEFTVDQEMLESVEIYISTVTPIIAEADFWAVEQTVELDLYWPQRQAPVPLFGTCDLFAYSRARRRLTIADYKHGAGVYVGHVDNAQMLYYAAGALALLKMAHPDETPLDVEMIICQPRVPGHEPIRSYVLPAIDILLWIETELKPSVEATQNPDAALILGDHCRWCPGRVICPAMLAMRDDRLTPFDPVASDVVDATDAEIAAFLEDAESLEIWINACREEAQHRIEDGGVIPGWGLTPTRPRRVWDDETSVASYLRGHGYSNDQIFKQEIFSPAQMQKRIMAAHWRIVEKSVEARSSGMKLARTVSTAKPFTPVETKETVHG